MEGWVMNEHTLFRDLNIPMERDFFLRALVRELAGILEDVVGYDEAAGYLSLVGQRLGEWINEMYLRELKTSRLTPAQVAEVLVDLKARIHGEFSVTPQEGARIVLENRACPFGEMVEDRPSMCMMTSNVFGVIAAENLGYAKVTLERTFAKGDGMCRVVVHLKPSPEAERAEGREYFGTSWHHDE
jgi:predicted ArsR family transcriptional regulator